MLFAQGQHKPVIRCRRLQFEVERAAKTFAQRESPGARDAGTERGVQNELHPAGFIEKPFRDHCVLGGQCA